MFWENELLSLLEECPVIEVSGSGEVNTKCWECDMVREGGLEDEKSKVVASKREKHRIAK